MFLVARYKLLEEGDIQRLRGWRRTIAEDNAIAGL
jgi:hypothetical protein